MEGDVSGVRIIPNVVEFLDTESGKTYKCNITVKNTSATAKNIRYYFPQKKQFKLKTKNPEIAIAPGLEVAGVIEFTPTEAKDYKDRIVVTVDGDVIEVPLTGCPVKPLLELRGPANFQHVIANSKMVTVEVPLYNHGSKSGEFKIKYTGDKPINIIPTSGVVPAKSVHKIKVEYITKEAGKFNETAEVHLEGQGPVALKIVGSAVKGSLELRSLEYDLLDCIKFGPAYYGTDKQYITMLYNNCPEPTHFVCILDEGAVGQETGVDLTKSTAGTISLMSSDKSRIGGKMNTLTSLVTAVPNQGTIAPYERIPLCFIFSPRWNTAKQGYTCTIEHAPRQDFSLFMNIQMVGSSDGFVEQQLAQTKTSSTADCSIEVALTGTALPVLLSVDPPQKRFDFGECPVGEHVDMLCKLKNQSTDLPVTYQFRRIAHFSVSPSSGKVEPGESHDIIFSFVPKQVGTFKRQLMADIVGTKTSETNPFTPPELDIIHVMKVNLEGRSDPITVKREPKFNPGISPKVVGEVGQFVDTTFGTMEKFHPKAAIQGGNNTAIHQLDANKTTLLDDQFIKVAFPNDRSRSIRPSERHQEYRTIFTKTKRHNYVDPDYAYTDEETMAVAEHKDYYKNYVNELRENRINKQRDAEAKNFNNATDIGMKPAAGLKPKTLQQSDIVPDPRSPTPPNSHWKMLSTVELADDELNSTKKPVCDGLNAIPVTEREIADCKLFLSPQQLHKVVIGPPTIDFGEVCLRSVSQKELHIINNLDQYIHVVVSIDCRELRQTSPLSQVIPPCSKATVPVIFESNTKGKFQRSVDYMVNGFYRHHVTALAQVVPVALEMSTHELNVAPSNGLPAEAGMRGVVTLTNKLNHAATFTWNPILGERGTAFSIRPATGVVEAFKNLECEVVFHPSYMAPELGMFGLSVHGGNTLKLKCKAKFGPSKVQFIERRIAFGKVPLHLTTNKTALLYNDSSNHSYFQVLDPNPVPGLTISPTHGVVPIGGKTELKIQLTPNALMKFDTRIQVATREGRTLELRMGGTVEPPEVDIDMSMFNLGGVFVGSCSVTEFKLINRRTTKAKVEFDLARFPDFRLEFPDYETPESLSYQILNPGMYCVFLEGAVNLTCHLIFSPTEVAAYDFIMPVIINQTDAPSPSPSPFPPTPCPSNKNTIANIINPRPVHVSVATPRRRVCATALRQPLQLSANKLDYILPTDYLDMVAESGLGKTKKVLLVNNSDKKIKWAFDLSDVSQDLVDGTFRVIHGEGGVPYLTHGDGGVDGELEPGMTVTVGVLFCPPKPGKYSGKIPVILNDDFDKPYQYLDLAGELRAAKLWFDPMAIVMTPVPLATEVSAHFKIFAIDYRKANVINVEVPEVECEDGSMITPLDVTFHKGQEVKPCLSDETKQIPHVLDCTVTFTSPKPVSFSKQIVFVDELGNRFPLSVSATADNSILTCYPFLSMHRTDHQIVCEQGQTLKGHMTVSKESLNVGEAIFVPVQTPQRPPSRPSTSATSSQFECSSSTYESSTQSCTDSSSSWYTSDYTSSVCSTSETSYTTESSETGYTTTSESSSSESSSSASGGSESSSSAEDGSAKKKYRVTPGSSAVKKKVYAEGSTYPSTPRTGALNKVASDSNSAAMAKQDMVSRSLGSALFPDEDTEEGIFQSEVLLAVQRWFSANGWPNGPYPICIPFSLRSGISKQGRDSNSTQSGNYDANNLRKDIKTIYDMIHHLCGRNIPGVPLNAPIPPDPTERVKQIHWQHSTLLTFMKNQGGCVSSIKPEYLMEPGDYKHWKSLQEFITDPSSYQKKTLTEDEAQLNDQLFEAVSKKAWTDILLQTFKILIMSRITPRQFKNVNSPDHKKKLPAVNPDPLCSNVYGVGERIILAWLNHMYEQYRHGIWENCPKGGIPPARWIVNFDFDLLDGMVIGAVLGAHCPFLVKTHLQDMYTQPATAEQCLHNALKVVNAMQYIGLEYDIQAIDITDPNPIMLMFLSVFLYQKMPQYLAKNTVDFTGTLHGMVMRQIRLTNPSNRPLTYTILMAGHDANDFVCPIGNTVTIPPKGVANLEIEFTSRFLRPAEATLILVGRRSGSLTGTTLVFTLRTQIDNITPDRVVKCESPCYELKKLSLEVANPFPESGDFRIVLVEGKVDGNKGNTQNKSLMKPRKKKKRKARAKINTGKNPRSVTPPSSDEEMKVPPKIVDTQDKLNLVEGAVDTDAIMSAYFCPSPSVFIEGKGVAIVDIDFLPFATGKRQCSVLFINENVGEFLYSIEAVATLPLKMALPFQPGPNTVRITSAAAAGRGRGAYGGDESVVYWKCEVNQTLSETIPIPLTNSLREQALVIAAQQHMSELELHRRKVTGTLAAGTVTAKAISMLSTDPVKAVRTPLVPKKGDPGPVFQVELDSGYFSAPKTLSMPNPLQIKPMTASETIVKTATGNIPKSPAGLFGSQGVVMDEHYVDLPIKFCADKAGHYPCRIVLRSVDDVRVYQIECTVNPDGSNAELEFTSHVHQAVTQNIPIINPTNHDWTMEAQISGVGFYGPPTLVVKAYQTTLYPLMYRPPLEGDVTGLLTLVNVDDGTEHLFQLKGMPKKPLALDHLSLDCEAKQSLHITLDVPNLTQRKLTYHVESDLSFINGQPFISVLGQKVGKYEMTVAPTKRGSYKGVISFIAGVNPITDIDSDGEEFQEVSEVGEYEGYRVWYSIDVTVCAPPPEKTLTISCPCQALVDTTPEKRAVLEVAVTNPTSKEIVLDVSMEGTGLSGEPVMCLGPGERGVYNLTFFPATVGESQGSLVFFNELTGEFWYDLVLEATSPMPTTLPHMECELGRWTKTKITLNNPTHEKLELIPTISNTNNFSLDRENDRPIELAPRQSKDFVINFMPSTLGETDHTAKISFHCEQISEYGEWVFLASGTGLLPQPQDTLTIVTPAGTSQTLIIPFRNPLDHAVLVDVALTVGSSNSPSCSWAVVSCATGSQKSLNNDQQLERILSNKESQEDSPFCLLLRNNTSIRVGPKSTVDIPIAFAPDDMRMFEALCIVTVRKRDGTTWPYVLPESATHPDLMRVRSGSVRDIRWLYPIQGIPEISNHAEQTVVLECQARGRTEERLEVVLTGVIPSANGPKRTILKRSLTPSGELPDLPEGVVIGTGNWLADEFTYEFVFDDDTAKEKLQSSIALKFVRQMKDKVTGLVSLVFNVVFAPFQMMTYEGHLQVKSVTGGVWRFPVKFVATEPESDDTIRVEANGLNKESSVGFRLTSQTRHPIPFHAFFVAGSDSGFTVSPQRGELGPVGSNGTLIRLGFTPTLYGKEYKAKLCVHTEDMQWVYSIVGTLPDYTPPRGTSSRPMAGPHPDPRRRLGKTNFVKENLKLMTTAVSSPIKGANVIQRTKNATV